VQERDQSRAEGWDSRLLAWLTDSQT